MCVAVDADGGFGFQGSIPWNIPEEFQHFKQTVKGGVCICGLNTFEDMVKLMTKNGKISKTALFNTTPHIIVSSYTVESCPPELASILLSSNVKHHLVNSIRAGILLANTLYNKDIWLIGGKRIFEEGLDYCEDVIQTVIPACYECDTWFPTKKLMDMFTPTLHKTIVTNTTANLPVLCWKRKNSA